MNERIKPMLALGGLLVALVVVQPQAQSLDAELQRAIQQEVVTGDLRAAIGAYEQIVSKAGPDRAIAAQALLRMAECHEKLGDGQARTIYERIVRDYPSQREAVTRAQAGLGGKQAAEQQPGMTLRKVWDRDGYDISADGRRVVNNQGGSVNIHDLADGADWEAVAPDNCAGPVVISNDGTEVAYEHYCEAYGSALRVVHVQGKGPATSRLLFEDPDVAQITPMDMAPDKTSIAVTLVRKDRSRQIALVATGNGSLRVLKSVDWRPPTRIFFSPDGRYLAYDEPASDATQQRDVFVMAVDGSRNVPLVVHPANDVVMGWSPDGTRVLFGSDRGGAMALWAQRFGGGAGRGAPELITQSINTTWSLGVTKEGALYLGKYNASRDLGVIALELATGNPTGPTTRPIQSFIGTNFEPAWSPDGKSLAYISWRSNNPIFGDPRILAIRSLETGETRELHPNLVYFDQISWAPDGSALVTGGTDLHGRNTVVRIDARSGAVTAIVTLPPGFERSFPQWSPDGARIYYRIPLKKDAPWSNDVAFIERTLASGAEREVARGNLGAISLSPDGRWIAARKADPSAGSAAIVVIPIDGGASKELLHVASQQQGPGQYTRLPTQFSGLPWTPDSQAILVRKRVSSDTVELWRVPIDGTAPRKLDIDVSQWALGNRGVISLSPDGRQLAYLAPLPAGEQGGGGIWALENFLGQAGASR